MSRAIRIQDIRQVVSGGHLRIYIYIYIDDLTPPERQLIFGEGYNTYSICDGAEYDW